MRISHPAAAALVGWYLMVPPTGCNGHPNPEASLSKWTAIYAFDDNDSVTCMKFRAALQHPAPSDPSREYMLRDAGYRGPVSAMRSAQCIATDDPRLAK